jgi:UDP-N-acetylmuramate-alanine ligase
MSSQVHFIAIGGSAMHNLAIALHQQGLEVTGSDDEIFEPSRSRLDRLGLMPDRLGWDPLRIHAGLSAVILGMHARLDNPELKRAQELGIPVYSYPSYFYERTKGKTRVVIGGSHGKTTITSMIVHVLRHVGVDFDYLVGAQLEGFDCMVKLSDKSTVAEVPPLPAGHRVDQRDRLGPHQRVQDLRELCGSVPAVHRRDRARRQAGLLPRGCGGAPDRRSAGG